MVVVILSGLSALIWLYLVAARGGFWRCAVRATALPLIANEAHRDWPHVAAIVPARNEADVIGQCMGALLQQDYPGPFSVVLVDDQSGDGTARVARETAEATMSDRLAIVSGRDVPPGWVGKLWAIQQGVDHVASSGSGPRYLLFTDADILHPPHVVRRLVAAAVERRAVLVSLMVRLRTATLAEQALIPAFIFFFQMLYPFAWVNDPRRRIAAAAGGCMLIDRDAFLRAGGLEPVRDAIIDDCAIARLMKQQGPIWLGLTEESMSLRGYPRFADVRRMVTRSAYAELRFSPWRLVGTVLGMAMTYLAPPLIALFGEGWPQFLSLFTYILMVLAFLPTLRLYGVSRLWALALPLIALVYVGFTVDSAVQHWRGRGGLWKGRFQAAANGAAKGVQKSA
jgi:hopene-associated glycosyltransferase HpnB